MVVWVLKNIDLFGTIRKKQKVKWNLKKKLRRKKMRCFTATTSLWTDLLAIGLNAWQKRKGAQGVIEIENPNLVKPKNVKARDLDIEKTTELSRREREEIEKQKAHERYMRLQEQGKTEQARKDLERLALIRQQRADAARKREEEKAALGMTLSEAKMMTLHGDEGSPTWGSLGHHQCCWLVADHRDPTVPAFDRILAKPDCTVGEPLTVLVPVWVLHR
ncbi:heat- and acid-stable phosphoprotein isoform X1 [Cinnamomum micranthum f. kanehirae]|uniref:Heat-and acid-stable phosphoprotein isoform X1 n=1 Tax=Cinnamomum micranthum f. kanehirae TaxID=337451 RepID=A0A443Q385_9MAGN|nr:heat- and acid-stable phosphoprotein isoform X1 [Cinnamomum micranthum f. kanehirae]